MAVIKMNFLSQALGMQTNVTICLPSYSFADRLAGREEVYVPGMKYQVLWLLHGGSGDDSDYVNFSNITRYADDNKLAVIMPADYNASYDDDPSGRAKYRTFVAEELPKVLRALFPLSDKREDNFIAGLSMGGGGTGKISINYPENYAAALIMSSGGGLNDPRPGQALRPCPRGIPRDRKISGTWPSKTSSPAKRYRNTSSPAAAMTSPWKALNSPVIS